MLQLHRSARSTRIGHPLVAALALILGVAMAPSARAASIVFMVTGTVTSESGTDGEFAVGNAMSATFTFDDAALATGGGLNFSNFDATTGFVFELPAFTATAAMASTLTVDDAAGADTLSIASGESGIGPALANGKAFVNAQLEWVDTTATLFSTSPPPLARPDDPLLLGGGSFFVSWEDPETFDSADVAGQIDSIEIVPEPATASLGLGLLLAGSSARGWRARRSRR